MEFIQDYIHFLPQLLPPSLLNPLITGSTFAFGVGKTLQNHLSPLFERLLTQPDTTSIILLLVLLFVSFHVLNMAYRAFMFWVKLAWWVVLYGGMAAIGLWIYNRGVDGFADDVQALTEQWTEQYDKYSGEAKRFQSQKETQFRAGQKKQNRHGWR